MRSRVVIGLLVLALALVCVPGVAAAAPVREDFVTGGGSASFFTNIAVNVSSGQLGENPTGTVSFDVPSFGVHVEDAAITCLTVSGRAAAVGVPVSGFGVIVLFVTDNGPAESGLDTVGFGTLAGGGTVCPAPLGGGGETLTSGDFLVVDAGRRRGLGCGDQTHTHTGAAACGQPGLTAGLKTDTVTGEGDFGLFTGLNLDVQSGPSGENPTGSLAVTVDLFGTRFESDSITCLAVNGTAATIGGTLKPNSVGYTAFVASVTDNGGLAPDGYSASPATSAPTICPPPAPFSIFGATGDIVVLDAGLRRGLGCGDPNHPHRDAADCKP